MSDRLFTKELVGRNVLTSGGSNVGEVEDVVIDTVTGEVTYLLINTSKSAWPGQHIDKKGRTVIAFNSVRFSGQNIIIS